MEAEKFSENKKSMTLPTHSYDHYAPNNRDMSVYQCLSSRIKMAWLCSQTALTTVLRCKMITCIFVVACIYKLENY